MPKIPRFRRNYYIAGTGSLKGKYFILEFTRTKTFPGRDVNWSVWGIGGSWWRVVVCGWGRVGRFGEKKLRSIAGILNPFETHF